MSNTDRDSMLERWADGMEKLEQYYEGIYGPPATPPSLPPITTRDAMLEAIADGMERAKRNINKKSPTYHSDSVAYVKTVPAGDVHYASLEQIGGKTVVWNQLIDSDKPTTTTFGITFTNNGDGSFTITGESTTVNVSQTPSLSNFQTVAGHKYFVCGTSGGTANTYGFRCVFGTIVSIFEPTIYTETVGNNDAYIYMRVFTSGYIVNTTMTPQVFDLTLMFGAGNEPTTVEEFQQTFPAVWYAYNLGSLLSAGVTSVVSKKADTTTIATYPIPAEIQALEGYGWSAGTVYNYIDYERKVFVKNVGSVVLDGTTSGRKAEGIYGNGTIFTNLITDIYDDGSGDKQRMVNVKADKLLGTFYLDIVNVPYGIAQNTGKRLILNLPNITTVADANTWLSNNNVTVYYELQTPIETDISAYLTDDNLIEVEAGGSLTFPNSNGDDYRIDVPSAETFVVGEP